MISRSAPTPVPYEANCELSGASLRHRTRPPLAPCLDGPHPRSLVSVPLRLSRTSLRPSESLRRSLRHVDVQATVPKSRIPLASQPASMEQFGQATSHLGPIQGGMPGDLLGRDAELEALSLVMAPLLDRPGFIDRREQVRVREVCGCGHGKSKTVLLHGVKLGQSR